ncbi:MAG TPA: hypothetical protein VGN17_29845 [Bryobacteraceae bacterium]
MRPPFQVFLVFAALLCASCSTPAPKSKALPPEPFGPGPAVAEGKNPLAKFVELTGFRVSESGSGKLKIKFVALNHSDADLGDLTVKVRLVANTFKEGDEPITTFDAQIPSLGPGELKDVTASATTKYKLYELPDWQFLRADFDITSPAAEK